MGYSDWMNEYGGRYAIRCYAKDGSLDHIAFADTLGQAEKIRLEWGREMGFGNLFCFYPTIWEWDDYGFGEDDEEDGEYLPLPGY